MALRETLYGAGEKLSFGLQDALQFFLDCPAATEAVHPHVPALADPYYPVARLIIGGWIPPLVEQKDMIGLHQCEAFAPDTGRGKES